MLDHENSTTLVHEMDSKWVRSKLIEDGVVSGTFDP